MAAPQTIRLLVEYDGSDFVGWQQQEGLPSVEGCLRAALLRLLGAPPAALRCAGRTDAGVHALGQVVSFVTSSPIEARRLTPALNHFLPTSIVVHCSEAAADGFDARRSSVAKRYRYRIYHGPQRLAVDRQRAWHVAGRLDLGAMRQAAATLVGEHDFNAFRSAHCDAAHARRHLIGLDIEALSRPPVGQFIDIWLHANAFCRHMCRILCGTLVEVGRGRRPADSMSAVLHSRERHRAGVTAPGCGLTLVEVIY